MRILAISVVLIVLSMGANLSLSHPDWTDTITINVQAIENIGILYDARTGAILASIIVDFQENKILHKMVIVPRIYGSEVVTESVIFDSEKLEQLDLGFHLIGDYPDSTFVFEDPLGYFFDLSQGRVMEITEPKDYHAVIYSLKTGEITMVLDVFLPGYVVGRGVDEEVEALLGVGSDLALLRGDFLAERGYGFHRIDNSYSYPEWVRIAASVGCGLLAEEVPPEMVGAKLPLYIFDLERGRLREMTTEEERKYYERLKEKAVKAAFIEILRYKEVLSDNRIKATLEWLDLRMFIETNSLLYSAKFNGADKVLRISISGKRGTPGTLELMVPKVLIPSTEDVRVYLDGNPIRHTITQTKDTYLIHVEYTHSLHVLTVNLIAPPPWYLQSLSLTLLALIIAVVLGAAYWFKLRR